MDSKTPKERLLINLRRGNADRVEALIKQFPGKIDFCCIKAVHDNLEMKVTAIAYNVYCKCNVQTFYNFF